MPIKVHWNKSRKRCSSLSTLFLKTLRWFAHSTNYPEPKFAKETPAFGLYARHVDGIEVDNVSFTTIKPDYRPAIMLDDVKNERITNIKADVQKGSKLIIKK